MTDNQPTLLNDITAAFAEPEAGLSPLQAARRAAEIDRACEVDKGHGRIEKRSIEVTSSLAEYLGSDWAGCTQVFRLTRVRKVGARVETGVVCGIASLRRERAGAKELLGVTRDHWGIENPRSDDARSGDLCAAGRARYHRRGGPARVGRVVRPAAGPRRRLMFVDRPDRVPPRPHPRTS